VAAGWRGDERGRRRAYAARQHTPELAQDGERDGSELVAEQGKIRRFERVADHWGERAHRRAVGRSLEQCGLAYDLSRAHAAEHRLLPPNLRVAARDQHEPLCRCPLANEKRAAVERGRPQPRRHPLLVVRCESGEQVGAAQNVERSLGCSPVCQRDCDRSYDEYRPRPSLDSAA
jgi:hypothetical protein